MNGKRLALTSDGAFVVYVVVDVGVVVGVGVAGVVGVGVVVVKLKLDLNSRILAMNALSSARQQPVELLS